MRTLSLAIGLAVLALILVPLGLELWLDARWFTAQGLEAIFFLRLRTQLLLGLAAGVVTAAFIGLNIGWATWRLRRAAAKEDQDARALKAMTAAVPAVSAVLGMFFGLAAFGDWQTVLGFQAQIPFGQTDPTFGRDIAFYVWTLPLILVARGWIVGLLIVGALATAAIYAIGLMAIEPPLTNAQPYPYILRERDLAAHPLLAAAMRHMALFGSALLLVLAGSYWLNNLLLVYSSRGVVFGASAT
ncbi:MAG: UPF0182 family protein, partial [Chloroflexi bacterium]|nr:UPF0182 family protein [Chloroflexota bacterium]